MQLIGGLANIVKINSIRETRQNIYYYTVADITPRAGWVVLYLTIIVKMIVYRFLFRFFFYIKIKILYIKIKFFSFFGQLFIVALTYSLNRRRVLKVFKRCKHDGNKRNNKHSTSPFPVHKTHANRVTIRYNIILYIETR